jgi:predicted AlkP superfamily pyrophosphatase or phosphodiesterase
LPDVFPIRGTFGQICFMARLTIVFLLIANCLFSQSNTPKLVVGIVVDQMRYDYLYRYSAQFGPDGFKRLLREGLSCENNHYDYIPTFTGPGHACVYTGAGPAGNGIVANEWWDREQNRHRYVTSDLQQKTVGADGKSGQHSPAVLLSTTITDELRLSNNFRSKVVGVCLKDRGSILPAGHIPNACYWFDDKTGNWITSTYYPDSLALPQWVQNFNGLKKTETYCNQVWDRLPGVTYQESFANWANKYDRGKYAVSLTGGFPHNLAAIRKKMGMGVIRFTPFGNTLTLDFAIEAMEQMQLGDDAFTDFLCLSFSCTDYAGHQFGVHAEETEDVYIRLDRDIARLLYYLDKKYGKDNVLVFLTADHGGTETPAHLKDIGIPADVFPESKLDSALTEVLRLGFHTPVDLIQEVSNQQVWLDLKKLDSLQLNKTIALEMIKNYLQPLPGIYAVHTIAEVMNLPGDLFYAPVLRKGIYVKRSGDLVFQLDPNWHPDDNLFLLGGATHGSSYAYDTHVPLLWYGNGIRPGTLYAPTSECDIAPTVSAILHIMEPSANTGKVIERVMER